MTQRNKKGQFKKGVSGNPKGRPRKRTEEQYLHATIGSVTLKDWAEVCAVALRDAKNGDKDARKFLADYLLGKPEQVVKGDVGGALEIIFRYADD